MWIAGFVHSMWTHMAKDEENSIRSALKRLSRGIYATSEDGANKRAKISASARVIIDSRNYIPLVIHFPEHVNTVSLCSRFPRYAASLFCSVAFWISNATLLNEKNPCRVIRLSDSNCDLRAVTVNVEQWAKFRNEWYGLCRQCTFTAVQAAALMKNVLFGWRKLC